ncbi:hypothetical protein Emin_1438 [Elusimicrobium minutum Pei191]|uniref:Putative zinc ribbon domain-containing protein n=1 Tax=Elusimicrobium minutum (strain Pei191) TaxID=445932 RepID=B2KEP1_ELUMP|nr:zinc ribbon domain-containing protein [Elusimicrobium minutum]ACC98987.1 hypothetical protein Emin_1438 [Elusimicrobium minutum Pei191]
MSENKFCQSCGMPMDKDPQGGGTNFDMTKNTEYCSYCYKGGNFTFIGDLKEFQEICKQHMKDQGTPGILAWFLAKNIKRLKRWKENR